MGLLYDLNSALWIIGNLTILMIFITSATFAVLYPVLFNPKLTTGGQRIWEAIGSVAGIGFLIVIGLFVDGRTEWWEMHRDIAPWRPGLRFVVFGWVAYTFGRLVYTLLMRRFRPDRLTTAPKTGSINIDPDTLSVPPRQLRKRRRR